jgi:hypothetical protein
MPCLHIIRICLTERDQSYLVRHILLISLTNMFVMNVLFVMDNPFAKTNAEHLLEPMFQIAEKYNIQLLCFSGIGGSAVYNRFNKIYVAKVVEDKFRNKENVSFKAGGEETLELSDFTISKEQMSLF